jgi:hypothetical protein
MAWLHGEAADRRPGDAVFRGRESGVHDRLGLDEMDGLDLVEVEWIISGHRTVQPGLQEGGPVVFEHLGALSKNFFGT